MLRDWDQEGARPRTASLPSQDVRDRFPEGVAPPAPRRPRSRGRGSARPPSRTIEGVEVGDPAWHQAYDRLARQATFKVDQGTRSPRNDTSYLER